MKRSAISPPLTPNSPSALTLRKFLLLDSKKKNEMSVPGTFKKLEKKESEKKNLCETEGCNGLGNILSNRKFHRCKRYCPNRERSEDKFVTKEISNEEIQVSEITNSLDNDKRVLQVPDIKTQEPKQQTPIKVNETKSDEMHKFVETVRNDEKYNDEITNSLDKDNSSLIRCSPSCEIDKKNLEYQNSKLTNELIDFEQIMEKIKIFIEECSILRTEANIAFKKIETRSKFGHFEQEIDSFMSILNQNKILSDGVCFEYIAGVKEFFEDLDKSYDEASLKLNNIHSLEKENQKLKTNLDDLSRKNIEIERNYDDLNSDFSLNMRQIKTLTETNEILSCDSKNYLNQIASLCNSNKSLEETIIQNQKTISQLQIIIENNCDKNILLKSMESNSDVENLSKELNSKVIQIAELVNKCEKLELELESQKLEIEKMQNLLRKHEGESNFLELELKKFNQNLIEENRELNSKLKEIGDNFEKCSNEINDKRRENQSLKKDLDNQVNEQVIKEELINKLKKELELIKEKSLIVDGSGKSIMSEECKKYIYFELNEEKEEALKKLKRTGEELVEKENELKKTLDNFKRTQLELSTIQNLNINLAQELEQYKNQLINSKKNENKWIDFVELVEENKRLNEKINLLENKLAFSESELSIRSNELYAVNKKLEILNIEFSISQTSLGNLKTELVRITEENIDYFNKNLKMDMLKTQILEEKSILNEKLLNLNSIIENNKKENEYTEKENQSIIEELFQEVETLQTSTLKVEATKLNEINLKRRGRQCPVPGCDSKGNKISGRLTHFSISNCPNSSKFMKDNSNNNEKKDEILKGKMKELEEINFKLEQDLLTERNKKFFFQDFEKQSNQKEITEQNFECIVDNFEAQKKNEIENLRFFFENEYEQLKSKNMVLLDEKLILEMEFKKMKILSEKTIFDLQKECSEKNFQINNLEEKFRLLNGNRFFQNEEKNSFNHKQDVELNESIEGSYDYFFPKEQNSDYYSNEFDIFNRKKDRNETLNNFSSQKFESKNKSSPLLFWDKRERQFDFKNDKLLSDDFINTKFESKPFFEDRLLDTKSPSTKLNLRIENFKRFLSKCPTNFMNAYPHIGYFKKEGQFYGEKVYLGPKNGVFYLNSNGNKSWLSPEQKLYEVDYII
ncbi:unnamed protein product [Brachionus calyciflorus]|uniref:Uncharacterized protein n=1 Tax=Brachionus calyciflorus TaxID=104777 RepID=A0A814DY96_9BILA|nr:unnamed protein product [Brachionus calyciflorus]